jgi:hypothetical protein
MPSPRGSAPLTTDEWRCLSGVAHDAGCLQFFGDHVRLADKAAFEAYLSPLRKIDWVVYAKEPFAGPEQVLRYLSRYTHRIAISNRRLLSAGENGVTFKYKDYRIEGPGRYKTMTLETDEFIRRFLIHVLPKGFHRILWAARQRQPSRKHCARAQAARDAGSPKRTRDARSSGRRTPRVAASIVPKLAPVPSIRSQSHRQSSRAT